MQWYYRPHFGEGPFLFQHIHNEMAFLSLVWKHSTSTSSNTFGMNWEHQDCPPKAKCPKTNYVCDIILVLDFEMGDHSLFPVPNNCQRWFLLTMNTIV